MKKIQQQNIQNQTGRDQKLCNFASYIDRDGKNMTQKEYSQKQNDEQIKSKVNNMFQKYDRNFTGKLDYIQISNFLKNQLNMQSFYDKMKFIISVNTDKGGLISKRQLYWYYKNIDKKGEAEKQIQNYYAKQLQQTDQQIMNQVHRIFQIYDKSKTGKLDSFKLQDNKKHQLNLTDVYEFIKQIDKDNDGLISKQQLFQYFKSNRRNK